MKLLLLTTGGTIDAQPYPEDDPPAVSTPSEDRLSLRTLTALIQNQDAALDCIEICNKDSKLIDGKDLDALERAILTHPGYDRVIVTIGTDRMTGTAQDLKARLRDSPPCPVVFTGAILPLANGETSDGPANLRLAAFGEPKAAPGIYITMHDLFAPCEMIRKDFERQRFVFKA